MWLLTHGCRVRAIRAREPGRPVRHGLTAREAAEDAAVARGLCRQQRSGRGAAVCWSWRMPTHGCRVRAIVLNQADQCAMGSCLTAAEIAAVARGLCRQQRRRQRGSSVLVLEDAYSVQSSSSALRDLRSSRVKALSLGSLRCSCSVSVTISWHWFSSRSKDISSMDGILDTNNHTSGQAITDSDSTNFTGKGQTYL